MIAAVPLYSLRRRQWLAAVLFWAALISVFVVFWLYYASPYGWRMPGWSLAVPVVVAACIYRWMSAVAQQLWAAGQRPTVRRCYWWSVAVAVVVFMVSGALESRQPHYSSGFTHLRFVLAGSFLYVCLATLLGTVELISYTLRGFPAAVRALSPRRRRLLYICWALAAIGLPLLLYGYYRSDAWALWAAAPLLIIGNVIGMVVGKNMAYGPKQQR